VTLCSGNVLGIYTVPRGSRVLDISRCVSAHRPRKCKPMFTLDGRVLAEDVVLDLPHTEPLKLGVVWVPRHPFTVIPETAVGNSQVERLKFAFAGDHTVGKSSLLCRFVGESFQDFAASPVAVKILHILVDELRPVKLWIWDSPTVLERVRSVSRVFFRHCHAVFVVFDVTRRASFENVACWLRDVREAEVDAAVVVVLIGNKVDCTAAREVSHAEALECASHEQIHYFETSAEDNVGVRDVLEFVVTEVVDAMPLPEPLPEPLPRPRSHCMACVLS